MSVFYGRDENRGSTKASQKKVTFDLSVEDDEEEEEDSEGEDIEEIFGGKSTSPEKSEVKSSYEKRQEKVTKLQMLIWFFTNSDIHFWYHKLDFLNKATSQL